MECNLYDLWNRFVDWYWQHWWQMMGVKIGFLLALIIIENLTS